MPKLLFINSSPRIAENSYTVKLANFFVEQYKLAFPENTLDILNLYDVVPPFLNTKMIDNLACTDEDSPCKQWVKEFKTYDKYLISSPTWNMGIPSILKAYIDLLLVNGETYEYNENHERVGLLQDKKMVIITASGDAYANPIPNPLVDMNFGYLKQIFNSLGIENIKHFGVDSPSFFEKETALKHVSILKKQVEGFISKF